MENIESKIFLYAVIVLSAAFHEYAHAWSANELGDSTAKDLGRLTLNPLKHIDPIGTVLVPVLLLFTSGIFIGWAKPVPYNPYNLRDKKYGDLKVGIAGPAANLIIAFILGMILRASPYMELFSGIDPVFFEFLGLIVYINIILALFNLLPVAPLDGSKILADLVPSFRHVINSFGIFGIFIAFFLAYQILPPLASFVFRIIAG